MCRTGLGWAAVVVAWILPFHARAARAELLTHRRITAPASIGMHRSIVDF